MTDPQFDTWLSIKSLNKAKVKTPKSLIDKGIYACSCCGKLNALEDMKCRNCNEPKFVITQ